MESKKPNSHKQRSDLRLPEEGSVVGGLGQVVKLTVTRYIDPEDLTYNQITVANNTVLYIGQLLRQVILKVPILREKTFCNYVQ